MNRIEKIILKARDTLADPRGERWSNERLLRLLDEAQKDLCRRAKVLRKSVEFIVFDNKAVYDMPEDFLLLDSALLNDTPLNLVGHQDLNTKVDKWETKRGRVTSVVFDKQLRGKIRLYPIPDYDNENRFTVVPSFNSYDYAKVRQPYGVVARISQGGEFTDGVFGVTTNISSLFQWQEEFGMPYVIQKDYLMKSTYGFVSDIILDSTPKHEITNSNLGVVTSVDGFEIDKFGAITNVTTTPELNLRFSDTYGESVDFSISGRLGFLTHFVNYGFIATLCNGEFSSEYGLDVKFETPSKEDIVFESDYGITESIILTTNVLKVFYIKKPAEIVDFDSVIEIDECFDNALKYYICGKALRDDKDTQNRAIGNEELSFYERELVEAVNDDMKDFTRSGGGIYEVAYNGGFL